MASGARFVQLNGTNVGINPAVVGATDLPPGLYVAYATVQATADLVQEIRTAGSHAPSSATDP